MALSYTDYTGDGSNTDFNVTFDYLAKSHVHVFIDDVEDTNLTWLSASQVRMTTPPALATVVRVRRLTPNTARLVDFTNGSTLDADSDLDTDSNQLFYICQEAFDNGLSSVPVNSITASKLADGSVTTAKLAAGAVTTTQITNDVVTDAKLANMGTQTIKGRTTAGTGDPESLTVTQVATMLADWKAQTFANFLGSVVTISDATVTLSQATHGGRQLLFTNVSGCLVTCPATLPEGFNCTWKQAATAGQITFQAGASAFLENASTHTKSRGASAMGSLSVVEGGGSAAVATLSGDTAA